MTPQRKIILQTLREMCTHPTADELYEKVKRELPNISLGTVYRNLDVLCRSGEAHKIDNAGGQSRYEGNTDPHYHVRCSACGRLDDIWDIDLPAPQTNETSAGGFSITGFNLEFKGICPDCNEK